MSGVDNMTVEDNGKQKKFLDVVLRETKNMKERLQTHLVLIISDKNKTLDDIKSCIWEKKPISDMQWQIVAECERDRLHVEATIERLETILQSKDEWNQPKTTVQLQEKTMQLVSCFKEGLKACVLYELFISVTEEMISALQVVDPTFQIPTKLFKTTIADQMKLALKKQVIMDIQDEIRKELEEKQNDLAYLENI